MINKILQFIKKQKFANELARFDCLFLLKDVSIFNAHKIVARFYLSANDLAPRQKVLNFLQSQNNPLLVRIACEISSMNKFYNDEVFYLEKDVDSLCDGDVLYKDNRLIKDNHFLITLLKEFLIKDCKYCKGDYLAVKKNMELNLDARLMGAELEQLHDLSLGFDKCANFDIDWIKTNQKELFINFPKQSRITQNLNIKAQENLVMLYGYLLFEKHIYISYFDGVLIDAKNHVSFIDFDLVSEASAPLKLFAFDYINKKLAPSSIEQERIARSLNLLCKFCPKIDVAKMFDKYKGYHQHPAEISSSFKENFFPMFQNNPILSSANIVDLTSNPEDVAYLLDHTRHKKDPRYASSSIKYWLPLLIVLYFLLKFF